MKIIKLMISFMAIINTIFAQNVGIGITAPVARFHIRGAADTTQLLIDASSVQSNLKPLVKIRNSSGIELIRIHSDDTSNVFIGRNAGRINDASGGGNHNTFIGSNSGYYTSIGSYNTANGYGSLYSNSIGNDNTGSGYLALFSNNTGSLNTAIGSNSLIFNITGNQNTATGAYALGNNEGGNYNTATGSQALTTNRSGYQNTAIGASSLLNNGTGYHNTAIGYQALFGNSSGYNNTAVGQEALSHNNGGFNNIAIGYGSGTHLNAPNVYNTVGIGNNDQLNGFQDQVIIGNTSTWFIGGKVNWGTLSDARIKNSIMEDVKGLDFILRLRPVTYHISNKALITLTRNKETADYPGKNDNEKIKYSGFLAQEVEQAAKAADYEFSGYDAPKNDWGLYTLKYAEFVVPLVKAVQEQQEIILAMDKRIKLLEEQNNLLLQQMKKTP